MKCFHFGVCGGCKSAPDSQPLPYAEELQQKEMRVQQLLAAYDIPEWKPIIPSPQEWYYRNKMEYAFAVWDNQLVLGLRQAGHFDRIVDLNSCGLMSEESLEVLKRV